MSFSAVTKDELARINAERRCCKMAELSSLIRMNGSIGIGRGNVSLSFYTENAALARKVFSLFKDLFDLPAEVLVQRKTGLRKKNVYLIRISSRSSVSRALNEMGIMDRGKGLLPGIRADLVKKDCCRKAYLRGAFLGGGSLNDPDGEYHLELVADNEFHAKALIGLMRKLELKAGLNIRRKVHVIYLKGSEQIARYLNITGAHSALLDFENIRIYKELRNKVNRMVNCDTANLNKTVSASVRQLGNIAFIASTVGLHHLPASLKQVAEARLNNPDISLRELGDLLSPRLGKSGVNHRFRKIDEFAENLRRK